MGFVRSKDEHSPLTRVDDALMLAPFPEDAPAPPEPRLRDVKQAVSVFHALKDADSKSAANRALVDSMFDGAPPFNPAKLLETNQAAKTNLNFGVAQRVLDMTLSSYVDLYTSLDVLIEVFGTGASRYEIRDKERIVEEEFTWMVRSMPEFYTSYLRLCTTFIKHGVATVFWDSATSLSYRVGGFSDILIPRQTFASEEYVDIAVGRREYHLHELWGYIKNPDAAKKVGWNVDEVRRVMAKNVRTTGRTNSTNAFPNSFEDIQAELKGNDIVSGHRNPTIALLHFWVREYNGKVSHFICAEDSPMAFMYEAIGKYDRPEQAYIFFTYATGSNGTYHSIRGLGQRIYSHAQTINRMFCHQLDGAMLASSVLLIPDSQRALDELQFTFWGAYSVLSPGLKVETKPIPDLTTAIKPALDDLYQQLLLNTDTISVYGMQELSPYRNQLQVSSDIDVLSRIAGAPLNLFYLSWTRFLREFFRRTASVPSLRTRHPAVRSFFERCAARGVGPDFISSIDLARTRAVRAIGNGSMANRVVALRELQAMAGQFDEVGRRNLTRDMVASRVGHDMAARYVPGNDIEQRPAIDQKIALLENEHLNAGGRVPVVGAEMHGFHLQTHVPVLQQLLEQYDQGTAEPEQLLPMLAAYYDHVSQTVQMAAGDPALESMVKGTHQTLQYAEEAINNTEKAMQKKQRDAMEQQAAEGGGEPNPEDAHQMEMRHKEESAQLQMEIAQRKAELEMALKQRKFDQEQALRDAETAVKLREQYAAHDVGPQYGI